MSYENPDVPHEVNVSREHPLAEFLRLAAGVALLVGVVSIAVYVGAGSLARFVPFDVEVRWVGDAVVGMVVPPASSEEARQVERYLTTLTAHLAARMQLPDGMTPRVHWMDLDVPNAFATLGGHIVVTRGLYLRMPSENALATVLAHEIGHLKHRDPISALAGSMTVTGLLALVSGDIQNLAPHVANLVQLGYSRSAEREADEAAVEALRAYYGHAGGAASVFEVLATYKADTGSAAVPSFLSTHPADADRIARLTAAAADWTPTGDPLRPLEVRLSVGSGSQDGGNATAHP